MNRLFFMLMGILLIGSSSFAQQAGGLRFLDYGADPLSLSLSETKAAIKLGAPSIFANPANLALESSSSLSATHTFWVAGTRNIHGAVNFRKNQRAIGLGIYTSLTDNLEAREVPGESNGTFSWQYYAFAGSYAYDFGPVSAGVTAMYLYEQVYMSSASGFAFNAGLTSHFADKRVRVAALLQNAGKMKELNAIRSDVPAKIRLGTEIQAVQFSVSSSDEVPVSISVAADFVQPIDWFQEDLPYSDIIVTGNKPWLTTAIRADIAGFLNLRMGYSFEDTHRPLSFGAGIRRFGVEADLAFIPFNDGFKNAVALGLRYNFR